MNTTFCTLDLLDNSLLYAEWNHPIDSIEPLDDSSFSKDAIGDILRRKLLWCADGASLSEIGNRSFLALFTLRPDLFTASNLATGMLLSARYSQDFCYNGLFHDTLRPVLPKERKGCVIVLTWVDQGLEPDDKGLRVLIVLRHLNVGTFGNFSFDQLGQLKGCKRQRVAALADEFVQLYAKGIVR